MADIGESGLLRSSAVMAVGTIASRITGVMRDMAMTAALGFYLVSDAYSLGNTLPNIIYILVAGGALNAVFIPQLVRHMKSDDDDGKAFADRLLSLVGAALLVLSIAAVIAAPWIVRIYATSGLSASEFDLAVAFARLCLPQIFFYGAYTMLQQVLNARGRFGIAMFAPIANNIISIVVFIGFLVVAKPNADSLTHLSNSEVWWLGLGTTVGVAAQALVLFPAMLKSGYRFNFRRDWKGSGLGHAGGLAMWTIGLVVVNQIAYAVITRLATSANVNAANNDLVAMGLTTYQKAHLIFVLPHSVIAVSLVTALLPQLSRLAHDHHYPAMAASVSRTSRTLLVAITPIAALLAVTAPSLAIIMFGNGVAGTEAARATGNVVAYFALGLPAYSLVYVLYRAWYAMENTRTPFWIAVVVNAVNLAIALPLFSNAADGDKIFMLALSYSLAYTAAAAIAWVWLLRKLPGLETAQTLWSFARVMMASVVAAAAAAYIPPLGNLPGHWLDVAHVLLQWLVGIGIFGIIASVLRISEFSTVASLVRRRLGN